jgi:serine/threonine-protein kinase
MGIVYRAKDRRLKRTVAIKLLPPELAFRSEIKTRFLREAETAAQLSHPNIVPIYSVDEAEGLVFFVMAYVDGENLAKRVHDRGVLPTDEVRRILRDVADALAYAHERGVVHRDIKPDNIIISAETGRPMVTDFGIARAVSEGDNRLTATGMAIGTPAYMSPEQAAGERSVDGRSDLYSLGIVAYQLLVGEPPFVAASTPAMLVKHISERPTPIQQRRSEMPDDLARAVMLLLEKDPANRFPSAAALVAALDSGRMPTGTARRESGAERVLQAPPSARPETHRERLERLGGIGTFDDTPLRTSGGEILADDAYLTTYQDTARWEHPKVLAFRRKLAPYLFVNGVIVIASIVGDSDFFGITVLWSIYLAFKYAKLWADGYDWRDVFRQPRDRELIDVVDDLVLHVRAIFDSKQRKKLREDRRSRKLARLASGAGGRTSGGASAGAVPGAGSAIPPLSAIRAAGNHGSRIRQATEDRDEIKRLVDSMPASERARLEDVLRSSGALFEKVQALALSLADLERSLTPGAVDALETEIARLEGAANPLDRQASEERVRRLAILRRQRRSMADLKSKHESVAAKLETCSLALQNMRLDMVRLRAGALTHQNITSLAIDALSLAESVDSALYVADEMGRLTARTSPGPTARP